MSASWPSTASCSSVRRSRVTMPSTFGRNVSVKMAMRIGLRGSPYASVPIRSDRLGLEDLIGDSGLLRARPGAGGRDLAHVGAVLVTARHLGHFLQEASLQGGGLQAQIQDEVV